MTWSVKLKICFGNVFTYFEVYCASLKAGIYVDNPAMQAARRPLTDATPPTGKIQPFLKMAKTFKTIMQFRCFFPDLECSKPV